MRRTGKSYAHPLVLLIASRSKSEQYRFGVTASRSIGGAVKRNLLAVAALLALAAAYLLLGRLFVDWGTVASEWDKVRLADISPSVGFGLSAGRTNQRFDFHIAWSDEGYEIYVGTMGFSDYKSRRLR